MTANAETKILPNAISLSCLAVCSIMPSVVAMAQPIAPPAFAWSLTRTFQPPPAVADEVHGSPAAVLCRSICWVLALGRLGVAKKSEEDLRALFSYLTQGRRFAYLESSRSSPWQSTMGWPNA